MNNPSKNIVQSAKQSCFLFPLVQLMVAFVLSLMVLDMGQCSHVVAYVALAYAGGILLMAQRRDALTQVDEYIIRWGFPMLCVLSGIFAAVIWPLRGMAM